MGYIVFVRIPYGNEEVDTRDAVTTIPRDEIVEWCKYEPERHKKKVLRERRELGYGYGYDDGYDSYDERA